MEFLFYFLPKSIFFFYWAARSPLIQYPASAGTPGKQASNQPKNKHSQQR